MGSRSIRCFPTNATEKSISPPVGSVKHRHSSEQLQHQLHQPIRKKLQVDRLSALPDDIILHILSFLEAEVAVRTGVLSKRFARLWTNLHCLNFDNCTTDFVNTTLTLHNKSHIEKFYLKHNYPLHRVNDVDKWIEVVTLANVKEFTLDIVDYTFGNYLLMKHVFNNPSLAKLTLVHCDINPDGLFVNWQSLRSLHIEQTTVSDECLSAVLEGCPSLEQLGLCRCNGFHKLSFANKCLKKLEIRDLVMRYDDYNTLEIVAPNLESLAISGNISVKNVRVLNAKSLVDCYLDFNICTGYNYFITQHQAVMMLMGLLEEVSNAENVTIGKRCTQLLNEVKLNGGSCLTCHGLQCLRFELMDTGLGYSELVV